MHSQNAHRVSGAFNFWDCKEENADRLEEHNGMLVGAACTTPFLMRQHGDCIDCPVLLERCDMFVINASCDVMLTACKSCGSLLLCECGLHFFCMAASRWSIIFGLCRHQPCISAGHTTICWHCLRTGLESGCLESSAPSCDWYNHRGALGLLL